MKKLLLFFTFLFCFQTIFTQDTKLDSIQNLVKTHTQRDSLRVKYLLRQAKFNIVRNFTNNQVLIDEALSIANEIDYTKGEGLCTIAYAEFYFEKGDFTTSLKHALQAVKIFEKTTDTFALREAKSCVAKIERENKNYQKGIEIYQQLLAEKDLKNYPLQRGGIHLNLANIYMSLKNDDFKKAKKHLQIAEKLFVVNHCATRTAMTHIKFARFYKVRFLRTKNSKNYQKAIAYSQKAIPIFITKNQQNNLGYAYYTLATTHSIANEHKLSIPFYKKALENYEAIGNLNFSAKIKQHLFVAYSILGKNEQARSINKAYVKLKDSIFGIEKRKLLTEAQTKYETRKIALQKEIAEEKSKKNRNLFISSLLGSFFLLAAILFYSISYKAKKKTQLVRIELEETQKRLSLEKQFRDAKLKALKAQMNPHFIFNALNSIQEYILLNKKNLASDYLGKFADLIRAYLHHSDIDKISLDEEVENLHRYLELECLRFEDLTYHIDISKEIDTRNTIIPTMLIQPYVENAIKHGLLHKKGAEKLSISFLQQDKNTVQCIIEDNGVGRKKSKELQEAKQKLHKSFATKTTQERFTLLNLENNNKIGVEIVDLYDNKNQSAGTKVVLNIPIIKE